MNKKALSRRQFVVGAGGAVTAAGAVTSQTAYAREDGPPVPWAPKCHAEADIIVVGFGAAGAAAACEAARAGARVLILDTTASGGGDTAISAGYIFLGGGTALQRGAGYQESPEEMFRVVRAMGGEGADPDLIMTWCRQGAEVYDWLTGVVGIEYDAGSLSFSGMEEHEEFRSLAPGGKPIPHCHWAAGATHETGGASLFAKLSAAALGSRRVHFKGQHKAVRLVQDPFTGRVVGVMAKEVDADGQFVTGARERFFRATKGVIVTTGAFSADVAMMARHNPNLLYFHHWNQRNADGSGIRMAQEIGGDVHLMKAWWSMAMWAVGPTVAKSILVNTQGNRFVAEDGNFYWVGYHMVARHQTAYALFDQSVLGNTPPDPALLSANTIEALADAITARDGVSLPRDLLRGTVDGYNRAANADGRSGRDPQFLKAPAFVVPLVTPPFYAMKYVAADLQGTTGGGLRVNPRAEVLGPGGNPIPGLYAAGTCASLTISERYTGSGTAIGGALVFGRIAGQQAAAQGP